MDVMGGKRYLAVSVSCSIFRGVPGGGGGGGVSVSGWGGGGTL